MFRTLLVCAALGACLAQCQTATPPSGPPAPLSDLSQALVDRWQLDKDGISWEPTDAHTDHIEFSGRRVSAIVQYGTDEAGELVLNRKLIWPMLRTLPNDTHASLIHDFGKHVSAAISIDGRPLESEQLKRVTLDGTLNLESDAGGGIGIVRRLFPSTRKPIVIESIAIANNTERAVRLTVTSPDYHVQTRLEAGVFGRYDLRAKTSVEGTFDLPAGNTFDFSLQFSGWTEDAKIDKKTRRASDSVARFELRSRLDYAQSLRESLVLETPDPVLNRMFAFAKLRAAESIFETRGGLMHAPGGSRYYAAIWANDQAEYVNPFFPYLGDAAGNESALNSFRHFARFTNEDFRPIPSSIIAEGRDFWNGAGDRGDQAMIAYGAARFALGLGDKATAEELWPLITWCLEYLDRKRTEEGVIASDSDELEGRFPAGDANLNTSMLTYGALRDAARLGREIGHGELAATYDRRAYVLLDAVETYFGAKVQGFDTYRYFDGNTKLRAWICVPLVFGVFERKQGTLDALLSPLLWSENGVYSEAGNETFWDRATLYAFRGLLAAGEVDTTMRYLKYYSQKRLLGEHVPYAVEAWPEGDQRHLSAESGLYCRVFTEGLFGLEPTGFDKLACAPRLPTGWSEMALRNIHLFDRNFDIEATRVAGGTSVVLSEAGDVLFQTIWSGDEPLSIKLN